MAFNLKITMDELYNMSSKEYMGWVEYFNKRPAGWQDDHRTALLLQTTYQGSKKVNFSEYFPSLSIVHKGNDQKIQKAKNFLSELQGKSISKDKIDLN
jgi:hypothetical protein